MRARSRVGRLLLGSTALAAALLATTAFAQDAAPTGSDNPEATAQDDGQVVIVTGIRRSLETAAQIKRKSDTFVDSITASDVPRCRMPVWRRPWAVFRAYP
ncbi:MAG: hypothetical protein NVV72_14760 [Asticcacaulis sp.]|nr:hypothetical protein [Asticcacaulis sp.]